MVQSISRDELKNKLDRNDNFTLVDVLSEDDYKESHIPGAINIPLKVIGSEAEKRFDKDDEIVVYCASTDCDASPRAAEKLEKLGFTNVKDYEEGKKGWKEGGQQLESGNA